MADFRQALQTLSRAPLANFVAERKRLTAELRAAGDEEGAKQVAQRRRPTSSAWTVNQLYWHARREFDALLAAAGGIRKGDLRQTSAYREALVDLRKRAAAILRDAGHAPTAATLGRVTGTLAAIAATGGFDPDPPGALAADREPPGFDAVEAASTAKHQQRPSEHRPAARRTAVSERARLAAARAEERARKLAETKARERHRLTAALDNAKAKVRTCERALSLLQKELPAAEAGVQEARDVVQDLERRLAALDDAH